MQRRIRSHESRRAKLCTNRLQREKPVIKSGRSCAVSEFRDVARSVVMSALLVALPCRGRALAPGARPAANWLEKGIYMTGPNYDGVLPPCEAALDKIASRFAQKEGRFWNSDLQILDFERVREIAYRPWAAGTIPRRFCTRGRPGQRRHASTR